MKPTVIVLECTHPRIIVKRRASGTLLCVHDRDIPESPWDLADDSDAIILYAPKTGICEDCRKRVALPRSAHKISICDKFIKIRSAR